MTATTTSQLVRPNTVGSVTRDEASLKEKVLARLANRGTWNPEVFANSQGALDIDIQRTREEWLTHRSLEDIGAPDHADSEVANASSDATSDFHRTVVGRLTDKFQLRRIK